MAGVEAGSLVTYLQKLRRLRLVERHIPVTESPTSSKRGRYRIAAPLFRFWFRFVYGNQDQLRMLGDDAYDEIVAPGLADYVSPLFKRLCQRALRSGTTPQSGSSQQSVVSLIADHTTYVCPLSHSTPRPTSIDGPRVAVVSFIVACSPSTISAPQTRQVVSSSSDSSLPS